MKNFNFRERNLLAGPHLLGVLLLLAGVFTLVSPAFLKNESSTERVLLVGTGAVTLGLLIVSSYDGTLIDFTKNRFKKYFSIGGYKFGDWISLPNIVSVKVISASYISTNTPNGISPTVSGRIIRFKAVLYSNASKPEFSFVYSNRDKALKHAKLLAFKFKADLIVDDI
ncbi:hypothetical protein [Pontibacter oryzae]|uniref:Uncharacterized protein n=1 Tax=Pontibacter oryzae TaxID=2304593 RepID=A0A399S183_9BACT|nr:hypothetical protein [Pontibacter oryzae]RIJ37038.1 hypothetical protein D1627_14615 [Pontibacter oryzae]